MREVTIARNYAEALLALAEEAGAVEAWGDLVDATAAAFGSPGIEAVLISPRVTRAEKVTLIEHALKGAPHKFVLFVNALIKRGRQLLLSQIADEYRGLVDIRLNRVRAGVTLSREADPLTRGVIVERLAAALGKDVIAGFSTDPSILGGVVIRIGDRVYDGSVRKSLGRLRQHLQAG